MLKLPKMARQRRDKKSIAGKKTAGISTGALT
jgi:hypothetical protein